MSKIIEPFADIFGDLMGCEEGETECLKDARKYASIVVYGTILVIVVVLAYKGHRMLKA